MRRPKNNSPGRYILDGHQPVAEPDLLRWGEWMEHAERGVAFTGNRDQHVSTVFLGLDHSFCDGSPPLVFETLVFGGPQNGACGRWATWEEAEAGHKAMALLVFGKALAGL